MTHRSLASLLVLALWAGVPTAFGAESNPAKPADGPQNPTQNQDLRKQRMEQDEAMRNTPVADRKSEEYAATGIKLGTFLLLPDLRLEESFKDNIYATASNTVEDYVTLFKPVIHGQSDWTRHQLQFDAEGSFFRYLENSTENHNDFMTRVSGKLDIVEGSWLEVTPGWSRNHEDRGSPDNVNGADPTRSDQYGAKLEYVYEPARVKLKVTGNSQKYNFQDARTPTGFINNDDRDRRENSLVTRVWMETDPDNRKDFLFLQPTLGSVAYDETVDDGGLHRDANVWRLDAGYGFRASGKLVGEAFVGLMGRHHEDPALKDFTDWTAGTNLIWNLTPLTTLTTILQRTIGETTVAAAGSIVQTSFNLQLDHELLRNAKIGVKTGYANSNYQSLTRKDDNVKAGLFGNYQFDRNLYAGVEYQFIDNSSTAVNSNFQQNVLSAHVGYRF
ncbi:MAG: outer membrane beta-barrel protein [Magnetococcales bacterium]|nr:outer membrane beta-barrel protein [Magnetococcales bacterium]